ncbi:O-antigen ligase family protein [Ilyomonas limi]|uniref:O-antigen ligase family protein n=1 Tax=Ilyomonas limi TaxID=2575867 RepID=A0A4U3KSG2_9BACT|nr:O-antigen ligase family protein [Ilyomonas limi]TKK65231.1 O-antigen ligase family protein [Ilyomonas limi]
MKGYTQIPISATNEKQSFWKKLYNGIILQKFNSVYGVLSLVLVAAFIALLTRQYGLTPGFMIIALSVGIPVLYAVLTFPQFGTVLLLLMAYLLFLIMSLGIPFPLGTLMDALQGLLILSVLIRLKKNPDWKIFKSPISGIILVWICYNLMEVANPSAESRLAWVYTVRSVAVVMLMYFVFMYNIRTVTFIRFILKMWLLLSVVGALWAYKQEFIGFSANEEAYLHSDPNIAALLFLAGHWRKFSIFSDPVAFSYNMVVSSLLCFALITGKRKLWKKIVLGFLMALFLSAMIFSGTRGAFVLPPAALALYAVLNFNKKVLIFSIFAALAFGFLIVVPTSNQNILRFQTAFKPSDDVSFTARKVNQKRIQPYILSHPMGGGLGATGAWGQRFAPNSYLAHFPPDSGYVRVAVELGWIGLLIFCIFMFMILKTGINYYYRIRDPELKTYCLAMVLIVFAFNVGNYPQEALVQFPSNVYFYLVVALINILYRLDIEKNGPITV